MYHNFGYVYPTNRDVRRFCKYTLLTFQMEYQIEQVVSFSISFPMLVLYMYAVFFRLQSKQISSYVMDSNDYRL